MRNEKQTGAHSTDETPRTGSLSVDDRDLRMERLRAALREGELSGDPAPFDMEQFIVEKKRAR